ncbi:MAG: hypothetical protein NT150_14530 [Bacteroidetes bacterium]|nr:hypothetical protein [Bacteroidota bacterium]
MEKLGRLLGTLLVLSLVFVSCKKDDSSHGKKGEKDSSFNDDFFKSPKSAMGAEHHYNCGAGENDDNDHSNSSNHTKITICHNGHLITISINAVFHHFKQHGTDILFDCDASKGVVYDDVISTLNKIIIDNNLQGSTETVMQSAFNIWYTTYYLTGNWPIPVVTDGGGDTGGGGGTGGGTVDTTPVVLPPADPTMAICTNGALIDVTYPVAFVNFQNGDILFSCDPSAGVYYSDVEGPLLDIIYIYSLDANASDVMYQAFLLWYKDYYLAGNWPPDAGGAGGGGAGGGDGGAGTGTDSTVVITN